MPKKSLFAKLMILVILAIMIPAAVTAGPVCEPPYCGPCSANQYDCTDVWVWENMWAALMLWSNGYTITVCCE